MTDAQPEFRRNETNFVKPFYKTERRPRKPKIVPIKEKEPEIFFFQMMNCLECCDRVMAKVIRNIGPNQFDPNYYDVEGECLRCHAKIYSAVAFVEKEEDNEMTYCE